MATEQPGKPQIRAEKEECPRKRCERSFNRYPGRGGVGWGGVGGGVGGSEGENRVSLDFCLGQTGWPWVAFYSSQTQFPHLC